MTRLNATSLEDITFREGDTVPTRTQKLEFLRQQMVALGGSGAGQERTFVVSMVDGLPDADPTSPLLRIVLPFAITFGMITGNAGQGAAAPAVFRARVNGGPFGTLTFTGTSSTDDLLGKTVLAGEAFELYPPLTPDPNLDDVSISIPVTVG